MNREHLARLMEEEKLDAIIATSPENVHYTSGSFIYTVGLVRDRMAFVVVPGKGNPTYLVAANERNQAALHTWISDVQVYVEFQDRPIDALARVISEKGLASRSARVGVERTHLPAAHEDRLRELCPRVQLVDCKSVLDRCRMIKSPEEIAHLERIATYTRKALESAFMAARIGDSEKHVANHIGREILEMGADFIPFLSVKTGPRLWTGHHLPGTTKLEAGNLIWCDYGGLWNGYFSDLARTYAIGRATPAQRDHYKRLREVYQQVIEAVTVGKPVKDLYEICGKGLEARGQKLAMAHIGHSIGVELHECPMISPFDHYVVEEGMMFNVEPGYAEEGNTIHIEDLILATRSGPRVLTGQLAPDEIPVIQ